MVTYCLGSTKQKYAYFRNFDAAVLENPEVLFRASENGVEYFAYGKIPFAGFSVRDYLGYRTSLCPRRPTEKEMRALGLRPSAKLGRLCAAARMCVYYLEKACGAELNRVVIDLDGVKCTRKNSAVLNRLLSLCGTAFVCVTDERFLKRAGACRTLRFGKGIKYARPKFRKADKLHALIGADRVGVM